MIGHRAEPIMLYAGTEIVVLESVESLAGSVSIVDDGEAVKPEEQKKGLL